jgi:hypothetical protein
VTAVVVDELYWRATYGHRYGDSNEDEERMLDGTYRAMGKMGWYTSLDGDEVSFENKAAHGRGSPGSRRGTLRWQNADMIPGDIHVPFRDQVDQGPY